MSDYKCKECGTSLEYGVKECPACGCPVDSVESTLTPAKKVMFLNMINPMAILSLLLGVIILIMGITVMKKSVTIDTYAAKNYNVAHVAFGGDFYTEIYNASDVIVDALSDINSGVESLSESIASIANTIYYPIGMIIVALGLGVIAVSFNHLKKKNI